MTTPKADVCYHLNVPEASPDGGAVLFEFLCKHLEGNDKEATDTKVHVWVPTPVLQSWVNVLPKILSDMQQLQASAEIGTKN